MSPTLEEIDDGIAALEEHVRAFPKVRPHAIKELRELFKLREDLIRCLAFGSQQDQQNQQPAEA